MVPFRAGSYPRQGDFGAKIQTAFLPFYGFYVVLLIKNLSRCAKSSFDSFDSTKSYQYIDDAFKKAIFFLIDQSIFGAKIQTLKITRLEEQFVRKPNTEKRGSIGHCADLN